MAPTNLSRTPVVSFDRIESLVDPAVISSILGPVSNVEREAHPAISSGYSSSSHEILAVALRDGTRHKLRLKRTHLGEDWLARLSREEPPGREASLLGEAALTPVWDAFARAHLAYAVEGSEIGLLMEDHSEGILPDVREPIGASHEEALLLAIASLHARFWESPALSLPWLSRPEWTLDVLGPHQAGDEMALRGAPQSIREGVPSGWRDALALLPADVASKLTKPGEQLWLEWSDLPKTLIHGDTKVSNFAFLPDGRVAAFDWTRVGAAPATLDLGWYLAVNSTRLARGKEELLARYRELLEARLNRTLDESLWVRMVDAGIVSGARMLLWSKALGLREDTPFRREDWAWWVARLTRWSRR
jgi:hypothetical protein